MASGRKFLILCKGEGLWLFICMGNGDQYRFRIKDVKWRGMFERFRFKEL